jgi:hypothetical protein
MTVRSSARSTPDQATLVAFGIVVLTGGLNAIAVRETLGELTPLWSAALRFLLAALIMLTGVIVTGRSLPRGRSLVGAMAYGTVGFAASFAFIYAGLVEAPAGAGAVLLALAPLFTFGLAIVQGLERFRRRLPRAHIHGSTGRGSLDVFPCRRHGDASLGMTRVDAVAPPSPVGYAWRRRTAPRFRSAAKGS